VHSESDEAGAVHSASLLSNPMSPGEGVRDGCIGAQALPLMCATGRLLSTVSAAPTHAAVVCGGAMSFVKGRRRLIPPEVSSE
jgi:hypothetical protein